MGYIVALTGGIGSGKSTVADAFSRLGIPIIDADIIARQVVEPNTPALKAIEAHFGREVINADGTLNRRQLRECIFSDSSEKAWLNALLHPIIHQETQRQITEARSPYVLWVVPLLVENQLQKKADRILVIDVSPETQIERTMTRDHVSREHAEQILAAQVTREARLAVADDVIDNNGAPDALASDVARLHAQYLTFAAQAVAQEKP
ncbi:MULTISPECIES: dephospho-CoA kinase [Enterobacter]|uniref:dephospho-CoA kinase n=2 Tax=Enterobacteriaceae TaxID=543 RepID=UPI0015E982ED|nr:MULTISPECIES: dephospho-CoA kinase [Enterobacter]HDR2752764.1 dephospho-CoA kinase [Enterobacter asburiae]QMR76688.1 dephospho-CoA kinase [Enterobacter sp. RHBSTW-00175]WNT37223.1 dephospho-CoA kinase [Enterobacter cloacae]HDR2786120.1 dephospho-CoA kinase [Enterobacter asburiae]HDR2792073.1 dephospho-CoA kinase [Enterobacter asburiae]